MVFKRYRTFCGTNLNQPLGSECVAVLVDNNTASMAYVPSAFTYIGPFERNKLIWIPATYQGEIVWQAMDGTIAQPFVTTQVLYATWMDFEAAMGYAGTSPVPAYQPPPTHALIGQFDTVAGTTTKQQYVLPTGSQGVMVVWKQTSGNNFPTRVRVSDSSDTIIWGLTTPTASVPGITDDVLECAVAAVVDSTISVILDEAAANTHHVFVVAVFQQAAVAVSIAQADINVPVYSPAGTSVNIIEGAPAGAKIASFFGTVTSAAAQALVTGINGQFVYVYKYHFSVSLGAFPAAANQAWDCRLRVITGSPVDIDGVQLITQSATGNLGASEFGNDLMGLAPGPVSSGLSLVATGNNVVVGGTLVYVQK